MLSTRSVGTPLPCAFLSHSGNSKGSPSPPKMQIPTMQSEDKQDVCLIRSSQDTAVNVLTVMDAQHQPPLQTTEMYGLSGSSLSTASPELPGKGNSGVHACPPPFDPQAGPVVQITPKTDIQKLATARQLSSWMQTALKKQNAQVAVVARPGRWLTKLQDSTGMEHSGLAVYDAKAGKWEIYELLSDLCGAHPQSRLCKSHAVDFFYSQPGYDKDAMILLPEPDVQKQVLKGIESAAYKKLFFTPYYNIVTTFDTAHSLNCNKWVLMHIVAARMGDYQPETVLEAIGNEFKPGYVWVPPFLRPLAKKHPTVYRKEVPSFGPIRTVTAESLYRSDLFPTKLFHSGKKVLFGLGRNIPEQISGQRRFSPPIAQQA